MSTIFTNEQIAEIKKIILDYVLPVGIYYCTSSEDDPNDLFGGKWVKVENKFIYAVGNNMKVNDIGGSKFITLNNLPEHFHTMNHVHNYDHIHTGETDNDGKHVHTGETDNDGKHTHTGETDNDGNHIHDVSENGYRHSIINPSGGSVSYVEGEINEDQIKHLVINNDPNCIDTSMNAVVQDNDKCKHKHKFKTDESDTSKHKHKFSIKEDDESNHKHKFKTAKMNNNYTSNCLNDVDHKIIENTGTAGVGEEYMPEYIAAYCWHRES